jgi:protein HOOK3
MYSLLSSPEVFDIGSITLDIQNNWALKLANLRRLKKAIDNYLTNYLKIPYVLFNDIRLGSIARKANPEDIIAFLELVFVVIINCPQKETFIRRIMDLDERSQYSLMLFIKKALGEGGEDLIQSTELNKKEIEILKNEKNRLLEQMSELALEVSKYRDLKEGLYKENEDLKFTVVELQHQLSSRHGRNAPENIEIYHKLEKKLAHKNLLLESLQDQLKDLKDKYDKDVSHLKDELDIAQSKIYLVKQSEKTLENYKKKIEKMTEMKRKMIEMKRANENMEKLIIEHRDEIETYQQYKRSSTTLKEEFNKEREKVDRLTVTLEAKEKQLLKLNKAMIEMSDKILFLQNRIHELEVPLDSSFVSEDSFISSRPDNEDYRRHNRNLMGASLTVDSLMKELNQVRTKIITKKSELKRSRETIKMQNEEIEGRNYCSSTLISQLMSRNEAMSDQLQRLSEKYTESDNEKEKLKNVEYELSSLKNYKDQLLSDIRVLYEEKDSIYKKYVQGREEAVGLNSKIHEKEYKIRDLELNLKLMNERFKSFEAVTTATGDIEELPQKIMNLEQINKFLTLEVNELNQRLKEKTEKIDDLVRSKEEIFKLLENERIEAIVKHKQEFEWKSEQLARQAEDAITQIQKEKDEIQSQLLNVKKSNLLEWKKAMMLKDPSMVSTDEVNKLKLALAELEKENEKQMRTNQELTICWKESARMVKYFSKLVANETDRMKKIMNKKQ